MKLVVLMYFLGVCSGCFFYACCKGDIKFKSLTLKKVYKAFFD